MKNNHVFRIVVSAMLCLSLAVPSLADVLTLPAGVKVIEEEAFYGDDSIDEVVLPEGIEEIRERAFANSGLSKINLPSSLMKIADNAFDKDAQIDISAEEGSSVWQWAMDHDYIDDPDGYLFINGFENLTATIYKEEDFRIFASKNYTATSDADWLSCWLNPRTNRMEVDVTDNATGHNRTGYITLKSGRKTAMLTVIQPDTTPKVIAPGNLSTNSSSPTNVGSGALFLEGYGCGLYVQAKSGSGWSEEYEFYFTSSDDYLFTEYIDPEYMTSGTTYRLRICDKSGRTKDYYIKRSSSSSSSATPSKTELSFPAAASSDTIKLTTSGSWTATADVAWLSISPSSGSKVSKKEISINTTDNTTGLERSGYITYKVGSVVCAKTKVTQVGTDTVFVSVKNQTPAEKDERLAHLDGNGESVSFYAFAPGTVSVLSNDSWLSVKKSTVLPGNSISVTADENTTGANRTGSVTFMYGSAQQTVWMTQLPAMAKPVISSPELSRTSSSPTSMKYRDLPLVLQWNAVDCAARYQVVLRYYTASGSSASYSAVVEDTGNSAYRFSLPIEWFDPAYTDVYRVVVYAYDEYDNYSSSGYSYFMTEPTPAPEQIVIHDLESYQMSVGDQVFLAADVLPEEANQTVVWESSASGVAAVSESGFLEALSAGDATITATAAGSGISASIRVSVSEFVIEAGNAEITGRVMNAADHTTAVLGAIVKLYKGSSLYATVQTDSMGRYAVQNLSAGSYRIKIEAPGYIEFTCYATIREDEVTYMENFLLIAGEAGQTGDVSGRITNAITNAHMPLQGVFLKVRNGWNNNNSGEIVAEGVTDADGAYRFTLNAGNYTINAEMGGYMDTHINICVLPGQETFDQNIPMLPPVEEGEFRIELRWGQNPSDLDSHLIGKLRNGEKLEVYYSSHNQCGNPNADAWAKDGSQNTAVLDIDDRNGYGPEVITLNPTTSGPYYYYVHHFTGNGSFATSDAKVNVYQNGRLVRSYNVPTDIASQCDWCWNVFSIINGQIVTRNTITENPEIGYADENLMQPYSIGGRVKNQQGNALGQALITVSDDSGMITTTTSNAYGIWSVCDLDLNKTYTIDCLLNGYDFETQSILLISNNTMLNEFTGLPIQDEKPDIQFTMSPSGIMVGEEVSFSVSAPGATRVRLLVDGESYDSDEHELNANGSVAFSRRITKYNETRQVSFMALINGEWSAPSDSQMLYMSAQGVLQSPVIHQLPYPHRTGQDLQIVWNSVDNADGYTVYLYNGAAGVHKVFEDYFNIGNESYGIVIPSSYLAEGSYSVEVMAFGTGYSQSSASELLWVRPPYEVKIGWPQGEKVLTYPTLDPLEQRGYVDYTDPVQVLDEVGDYYFIEMIISEQFGGGTARRFVRKDDILIGENAQWQPSLPITVLCVSEETVNHVKITVISNERCKRAGIRLNGSVIAGPLTETSFSDGSRKEYEFGLVVPEGLNQYIAFVSDGDKESIYSFELAGKGLTDPDRPAVPDSLNLQFVSSSNEDNTHTCISSSVYNYSNHDKPGNIYAKYRIPGDTVGIKAFLVNESQSGEVSYIYAGQDCNTSNINREYTLVLNPYKNGTLHTTKYSYKNRKYTDPVYKYIIVPSALVPDCNISGELVDYLRSFNTESRSIVRDLTLAFIPPFDDTPDDSASCLVAHYSLNDCTLSQDGLLELRNDDTYDRVLSNEKAALVIFNMHPYFAIAKYGFVYLVKPSEVEQLTQNRLVVPDCFQFSLYEELGIWYLRMRATNCPKGVYYIVRRSLEDDKYHYLYRQIEMIGDINIYSYVYDFSLEKGKTYDFAVVTGLNNLANADYAYTVTIPTSTNDDREELVGLLKTAVQYGINPLNGLYDNSQRMNSISFDYDRVNELVNNYLAFHCGFDTNARSYLISCLTQAMPIPRNLYLFSMLDYKVGLCNNKGTNHVGIFTGLDLGPIQFGFETNLLSFDRSSYANGMNRTMFTVTWFHESGHALDYVSFDNHSHSSLPYYNNLRQDFAAQVGKAVSRVCEKNYGKNKDELDISDAQVLLVAGYLMNTLRDNNTQSKVQFDNLRSAAQKNSGVSWDSLISDVILDLKEKIVSYAHVYRAYGNALMVVDTALGMTDNLLYYSDGSEYGHYATNYNGKSYWFNDDGTTNGMHVKEAFAEYFSSQIHKKCYTENRDFFPSTCSAFDELERRMLNYYVSTKYSNVNPR